MDFGRYADGFRSGRSWSEIADGGRPQGTPLQTRYGEEQPSTNAENGRSTCICHFPTNIRRFFRKDDRQVRLSEVKYKERR